MSRHLNHVLVGAFLAMASVPATATNITFADVLGPNGDTAQQHDGFDFLFSAGGWAVSPDSTLIVPGLVSNGTSRLILSGSLNALPGQVTLTQIGGGAFTVARFDAASAFIGTSGQITVTGIRGDSSEVQQVFSVTDQFATYNLSNSFTNLAAIRFAEIDINDFRDQGLALDNITSVGAAVPEPASWAMLITGFGLVGAATRRRRAAALPA
jgi:hypothetical protein